MVVVRSAPTGDPEEVSPPAVSVRSRVHEYGGGAVLPRAVCGGRPGPCLRRPVGPAGLAGPPHGGAGPEPLATEPLTPAPPAGHRWHHGDLRATGDGGHVLCVREAHDGAGGVTRTVVALSTGAASGGLHAVRRTGLLRRPPTRCAGDRLAWLTWDHPDMPWDATELWVGELHRSDDGGLAVAAPRLVAGGRSSGAGADGESVGQPLWLDDGRLVFVSDAAGWWQPWCWEPGGPAVRLCGDEGEFHGPDWVLGQSTMAELEDGRLGLPAPPGGHRRAGDGADGRWGLSHPRAALCVGERGVRSPMGVWPGSDPRRSGRRGRGGRRGATGHSRMWHRSAPSEPARSNTADVSVAEPFSVTTERGELPGLYYRPTLAGVHGPDGALPPLVVFCHSGPTGCAEAGFDPVLQFFTSHGFAVAAVDYAGSTGYGRAYRRRLRGAWGLADADDCAEAALALAERGLADGDRMAVRGSSAGGFTALCALARSRAFAAAVSWYGVTDLAALAASTHDFEAHYNDRLVGPLPEAAEEYRRRSPVNLVDEMEGAVLVLQGLDDPVVPPEQATAMVAALRLRGLRVEYLGFEGESHGFRRAETMATGLAAELAFYQEILCS